VPVRDKLDRWLASQGVELPAGPVRVLTNLRVLGHVFNPVSWWYCYHPDGELALVVAEVHNTFGESHGYVLDDLRPVGRHARGEAAKVFHVSPFLPIEGLSTASRSWSRPGARVLAHIDVTTRRAPMFDATQDGPAGPADLRLARGSC
jgi:uncharacterized protein